MRSSPQRNWPFIGSQLQIQLEENPAKALELHKSVYLFVFCDPHAHIHFSPLRATLIQGKVGILGVESLPRHTNLNSSYTPRAATVNFS